MSDTTQEFQSIDNQSVPRSLRTGSSQEINDERTWHAFLINLRHELRTPLNAIIGYSDMLRDDAESSGPKSFLPDIGKIHEAGHQLLALVNDILDPKKIEVDQIAADPEEFGATLRHELRTPLNAIIGYSEILLEDANDTGHTAFLPDLHKIHTAAERFLAEINDIVNFTNINAGTESVEANTPDTVSTLQSVVSAINSLEEMPPPVLENQPGHLLVVDDNEMNRDLLSRQLERQGHSVMAAENGRQALDLLQAQSFDLVLLDIMMPEMNGYQVLEILKNNNTLHEIPVIMISALDEMDSVIRCIEMGAEDYLPKPFNPVLLKARIGACLEHKRFHDKEVAYLRQLQREQEKSEKLLLNILPGPIAERLKQGERTIADSCHDVTVLFADIVGFTELSSHMPPTRLVMVLNALFSVFDRLAGHYGLEKIKTVGDAYMVVGGVPVPRADHAEAIADMALDMQRGVAQLNEQHGQSLSIRIGMHSGPVVAGVIGSKKFSYDLWGDTVNTASRMESHGVVGGIQVTTVTYNRLKDQYRFEERGEIQVKGKGQMTTYLLRGRKNGPISENKNGI